MLVPLTRQGHYITLGRTTATQSTVQYRHVTPVSGFINININWGGGGAGRDGAGGFRPTTVPPSKIKFSLGSLHYRTTDCHFKIVA